MSPRRTAVVTGAASGIGAATADLLTAQGCRVIGVDLRDAAVTADLSAPDGRATAVAAIGDLLGEDPLDVVVTCAGTIAPTLQTVRLNFDGTVRLLESLRPWLARSDAARVVALASFAAAFPMTGARSGLVDALLAGDEAETERLTLRMAGEVDGAEPDRAGIYPAAKTALARWVRRSAPGWAADGITLNAVAPGMVRTPMIAAQLATPERRARLEDTVPMPLRGPAAPEEIAAVVAWLAGAGNTLITGQVLFADGGADAVLRGDSVW
ncbi:SDR family oxidoreductase [Nakamurella sp. YIM 132087]|uniref:SDR family oxidoreductase n=1 Tax=Nakamurella alba TaxID=2665158 RepID=A0A7K1FIF8_9ACTN|nr:SDR family oxidoreductase [Nakamurella alba]MTD13856.1 SDR family oxidoreductase [Nakamurella alba]